MLALMMLESCFEHLHKCFCQLCILGTSSRRISFCCALKKEVSASLDKCDKVDNDAASNTNYHLLPCDLGSLAMLAVYRTVCKMDIGKCCISTHGAAPFVLKRHSKLSFTVCCSRVWFVQCMNLPISQFTILFMSQFVHLSIYPFIEKATNGNKWRTAT